MKNRDQAGLEFWGIQAIIWNNNYLEFLGIQAVIWSWIRSAHPCAVYQFQNWLHGSYSHWDFDPSLPKKNQCFWSLGKFLEKCWISSWDWSLEKLTQQWWRALQHWIFHGFRDHSQPQWWGKFGFWFHFRLSQILLQLENTTRALPHPWELLWIPFNFPPLSFHSLSLQGERLDSNPSSLGNSHMNKKCILSLFLGDILEANGIIWERANNWNWHFVVSKGWTFPALMIPWSHIFCAKTQKKTKLTLLISIWPENDLLRLFGVIKICFKRVNHYNFKT